MQFEWTDLLWHLLALPLYQTIGTALHELMHAIAGKRAGFVITEFRWYPGKMENGRFAWGWVNWDYPDPLPMVDGRVHYPKTTVTMYVAPYYLSMVKVVIGAVLMILMRTDVIAYPSFHVWAAMVVLLLISPVVEGAYQVWKWKYRGWGDLAEADKLRKELEKS